MDKKGLLHMMIGLIRGGLSLSLIVAVLEALTRGHQQKLRKKGVIGIVAAMALSFLLPYAAKIIYRAIARPRPARA